MRYGKKRRGWIIATIAAAILMIWCIALPALGYEPILSLPITLEIGQHTDPPQGQLSVYLLPDTTNDISGYTIGLYPGDAMEMQLLIVNTGDVDYNNVQVNDYVAEWGSITYTPNPLGELNIGEQTEVTMTIVILSEADGDITYNIAQDFYEGA